MLLNTHTHTHTQYANYSVTTPSVLTSWIVWIISVPSLSPCHVFVLFLFFFLRLGNWFGPSEPTLTLRWWSSLFIAGSTGGSLPGLMGKGPMFSAVFVLSSVVCMPSSCCKNGVEIGLSLGGRLEYRDSCTFGRECLCCRFPSTAGVSDLSTALLRRKGGNCNLLPRMGVLCLVGWNGLWLSSGDEFMQELSLASSLFWEASKTLTLFAVRELESIILLLSALSPSCELSTGLTGLWPCIRETWPFCATSV